MITPTRAIGHPGETITVMKWPSKSSTETGTIAGVIDAHLMVSAP